MKILVLMPCDERMTYIAAKIYQELPSEIKDITFSIPMFMDYLISSKIVGNWIYAFFDALVSMKNVYNAAVAAKGNLIIFGTAPRDLEFDAVFSFQDDNTQLSYEDKFLEKIKEIVVKEPLLAVYVKNLYNAQDSQYDLYNCKLSAGFLTDYIKTESDLEAIKEKYNDKLNFREEGKNGTSLYKKN